MEISLLLAETIDNGTLVSSLLAYTFWVMQFCQGLLLLIAIERMLRQSIEFSNVKNHYTSLDSDQYSHESGLSNSLGQAGDTLQIINKSN